ncbi:carboxypeptidase regulatory-like domain-containing protein [Bacteroidota bacterium]
MHKYILFLAFSLMGMIFSATAQNLPEVIVDVNLDINHSIDTITVFDRSKFITIHEAHTGNDWNGEMDKMDYVMNELDTYFGRNTGSISWDLNQVAVDAARPGFPSPANMQYKGQQSRENYAYNKTDRHPYEHRAVDLIVGAQVHPFWPDGKKTNPCCGGTPWALANADATAEFMAKWINLYRGGIGQAPPKWVEVMNEPIWVLVHEEEAATPGQVFAFHNTIATGIKAINPEVKVGGYTAAFPNFQEDNFDRWEERWKLFIDTTGTNMDFLSFHLYDFALIGGKQRFRKGANIEATFDMLEHYTLLSQGKVKPMIISEYGSMAHDLSKEPWTPYRDWLFLKSINSQLMSFMERPDKIISTIPFIVLKAEWGRTDVPYNHRLMREAFEAEGESGTDWVFTDLIKFYELWADVRGKRVDTKSTDPDCLTDAFSDGRHTYVIINNLGRSSRDIGINLAGAPGNSVQDIMVKHLHEEGREPILDTSIIAEENFVFELGAEATMIVRYTFANTVDIANSSVEEKLFAESYYREIKAGEPILFNINGASVGTFGEAVLRIGLGRDFGKSLKPLLTFNDSIIDYPLDFRFYEAGTWDRFFGVVEVPLPYSLLTDSNRVSMTFEDEGGHISSLALQTFNMSREVLRSEKPSVFNANFFVKDGSNGPPLQYARVIFAGDTIYSDSEGRASFDSLPAGTYSLDVTMENFKTFHQSTVSFSGNLNQQIKLEPFLYNITFFIREKENNEGVGNASLSIGERTTTSNSDGIADMSFRFGDYSYTVENPFFESTSGTFNVQSDTSLVILMKRTLANVKFWVMDQDGESGINNASVSVADTTISTVSLGLATFRGLKVDTNYTFSITRNGYSPYQGNFILKQDSILKVWLVYTSIESPSANRSIKIHPNPATKELHLDFYREFPSELTISLTDITGRAVKTYNSEIVSGSNRISLDISDVKPGMYILSIESGNTRMVKKILKQNL